MQILQTKQTLTYVDHGVWNKETDTYERPGGGRHLTIAASNTVQTVPDWIRDTPTFKNAERSGLVLEISTVSPSVLDSNAGAKQTKPVPLPENNGLQEEAREEARDAASAKRDRQAKK